MAALRKNLLRTFLSSFFFVGKILPDYNLYAFKKNPEVTLKIDQFFRGIISHINDLPYQSIFAGKLCSIEKSIQSVITLHM